MTMLLQRVKSLFPRAGFARNVVLLAGGTALGQSLALIASPLLTRLYSPDDFGILTVYISMLSILGVVAAWRYELAIPLPADDAAGAGLLVLSFLITLIMGCFTAVGVYAFGLPLMRWLNSESLVPYLWLLPFSFLALGAYQALNAWAIRKGAFSRVAQTKLSQGVGQTVVQCVLGALSLGPLGLIAGDVVGRASGTGTLAILALRSEASSFGRVSYSEIRTLAWRYRRFPLMSSFSALLNVLGLQLPALFFAAVFGTDVAGNIALGQRVIGIPLSLVSVAVSQVYLNQAAILARSDLASLRRLFLKTAVRLALVGTIPVAIIGLAGPWLFGLVFGSAWSEAGRFLQILALMVLSQFVVVPLSQTLNVLERQGWQLVWDTGRLALVAGSLWLSGRMEWSPGVAVALYGASMTAAYMVLYAMCSAALRRAGLTT